jgi:hypothetical protein
MALRGVSIKERNDFINFTTMPNEEYVAADRWLTSKLSKIEQFTEKDIAQFFAEEENITRAKIYKDLDEELADLI